MQDKKVEEKVNEWITNSEELFKKTKFICQKIGEKITELRQKFESSNNEKFFSVKTIENEFNELIKCINVFNDYLEKMAKEILSLRENDKELPETFKSRFNVNSYKEIIEKIDSMIFNNNINKKLIMNTYEIFKNSATYVSAMQEINPNDYIDWLHNNNRAGLKIVEVIFKQYEDINNYLDNMSKINPEEAKKNIFSLLKKQKWIIAKLPLSEYKKMYKKIDATINKLKIDVNTSVVKEKIFKSSLNNDGTGAGTTSSFFIVKDFENKKKATIKQSEATIIFAKKKINTLGALSLILKEECLKSLTSVYDIVYNGIIYDDNILNPILTSPSHEM